MTHTATTKTTTKDAEVQDIVEDISKDDKAVEVAARGTITDIRSKIDHIADIMLRYMDEYDRTYKSVKQIFGEIIKMARLQNIDNTELRKMLDESFKAKGVSESYLRKLMPRDLKQIEKTNKRYIIPEQQEQVIEIEPTSPKEQVIQLERITDKDKQLEASLQKVKQLSQEVEYLRSQEEVFTAKGFIDLMGQTMPVKVTVNVKNKSIESIEIDRDTVKKSVESEAKKAAAKIQKK